MRRHGHLLAQVTHPDNMRLAWVKTQRGKSTSPEVCIFARNLDDNLSRLAMELAAGSWTPGQFHQFVIHDPKIRTISAAPLPDRVIHHAIMNILDPLFDARLNGTTYACRRSKGTHRAVLKALSHTRHWPWFLKLDVRRYFDSIDHSILRALLQRFIKDGPMLALLDSIIDSYQLEPGKGLPIGNLTSQYFANHYLSAFDTLVSMKFPCAAYIRYMDDMVFWAANARDLAIVQAASAIWLLEERSLTIKAPVFAPCALGLPFLGFRILPGRLLLAGKTRRRYTSKLRTVDWLWRNGKISDDTAAKSASALAAMTSLARSRCFRHTATYGGGLGLEPGQSGW